VPKRDTLSSSQTNDTDARRWLGNPKFNRPESIDSVSSQQQRHHAEKNTFATVSISGLCSGWALAGQLATNGIGTDCLVLVVGAGSIDRDPAAVAVVAAVLYCIALYVSTAWTWSVPCRVSVRDPPAAAPRGPPAGFCKRGPPSFCTEATPRCPPSARSFAGPCRNGARVAIATVIAIAVAGIVAAVIGIVGGGDGFVLLVLLFVLLLLLFAAFGIPFW